MCAPVEQGNFVALGQGRVHERSSHENGPAEHQDFHVVHLFTIRRAALYLASVDKSWGRRPLAFVRRYTLADMTVEERTHLLRRSSADVFDEKLIASISA